MVIGVDFDNTICVDEWPEIGEFVEGAIETLKELKEKGHKLILYTQRNSDYYVYCPELVEYGEKHGKSFKDTVDILNPVLEVLSKEGIKLDWINENPEWELSKQDYGRKVYFDLLIDDHNAGIKRKTVINKNGESCKVVDWKALREWLIEEGVL